jgi:hypothetical protein
MPANYNPSTSESNSSSESEAVMDGVLRRNSINGDSADGVWRIDLEMPILIELPVFEQVELLYRHAYFAEVNRAHATHCGFDTSDQVVGFRLEQFMPRDLTASIPSLTQLVKARYQIQGERLLAWAAMAEENS